MTTDTDTNADAVTDQPPLEIIEFTDPLCPWAWGSEPVFRRLRAALAGHSHVRWRRAYCILFDHDDDPAPDPAAETAWYSRYVEDISAHTHAPRALRLRRVAASSWPASLLAKAAEAQGAQVADRVLRRLRESVFVLGEPADTPESALAAVSGVPGLDAARLAADAASPEVLAKVRADRAEARRPVDEVLSVRGRDSPHPGTAKETPDGQHRYALPTLLVRTAGGDHCAVPGWRPYEEYVSAINELSPGLLSMPTTPNSGLRPMPTTPNSGLPPTPTTVNPGQPPASPPPHPTKAPAPTTPAPGPPLRPTPPAPQPLPGPAPLDTTAALAHYRTLTDPERTLLTTGGPWPPPAAVRIDTANGPLWLHPDEAAVHPATTHSPPCPAPSTTPPVPR